MDQQIAKQLAQELLTSDRTFDRESFQIKDADPSLGDTIVVIVIRTNKRGEETLRKLSESIATKSVAGPKGTVCPVCNGTGRIG